MEAIRIIKTITSDRLPELNNYKGRSVEIIILPVVETRDVKEMNESLLALRGSLKTKIDGMEFQNQIRKEWERE
ncbi:MAG TPA: hypothetical protein PK200_14335 [Spirochaetota bacterium]|nr:hypothetical protein [Spirochaetota bacterium]HQO04089.1 hypothetical protein [Spirochaetota bacterium]HQP48126.1 hypothetical protein [Spirochaetota bacterium]